MFLPFLAKYIVMAQAIVCVSALVLLSVVVLVAVDYIVSRFRLRPVRVRYDYDVIIVGGSIAGPAVAKALAAQNRQVLLLERSLFTKPNRIVGELLQPGGVLALRELGMEDCAVSVGMPCDGYVVVDEGGLCVQLPYATGHKGYSFHFGDFVNNLRENVWRTCGALVTMREATVNAVLVERVSPFVDRAYGVVFTADAEDISRNRSFAGTYGARVEEDKSKLGEKVQCTATSPLIIMCDGGSSKFKAMYQHYTPAATYHSNFIGLILRSVHLPRERHGTIFFAKTGPILSYRLDANELRVLIDYGKPSLPSVDEQSKWLIHEVAPSLAPELRSEFIRAAEDKSGIRSMPVAQYPPAFPSVRGYVGIGDHANQRHPLTGGGMTCALNDAICLAERLSSIKRFRATEPAEMAAIEDEIQRAVVSYSRKRIKHSSSINILSWALYDVFHSSSLRKACLEYFVLGGECITGPMALLAGLSYSWLLLLLHYARVMLNGALNILTRRDVTCGRDPEKPGLVMRCINTLTFGMTPSRVQNAFCMLFASTCLVIPLAYMEFVSPWRLLEPTGLIAHHAKIIHTTIYRTFLSGRSRKPIGL
ncbi:putative squalene monooxygenase [Trypanosoma vivax]|uniref:Squalene monooxygenase n=1 Tax=Trypanosoma vivax (strain Y486) TaxID=1055687 RepID=G0UAL6_TRYVY|nr:putative squalene monooxygenase [Trypanosoma vivax]CCC52851.1 putative squalene monooxygenase [Trypanosoma vivax Y486]